MRKIGITGATGQLGRLIVEKLKAKVDASNLVALVRSPEKAADLGIEARKFDYNHPAELNEGLKGIDFLMMVSASEVGKRLPQHRNIIEAAKKNGVNRIVYTSLLHADTSTISLAEEHRATEAMLKSSGIPYTILRNGWYTENYTMSIANVLNAGVVIGASGEGKISAATREDYAEAAAAVLTGEGHEGKVYELAGDEPFTMKEYAAEIAKQTGKDIQYVHLTVEEYAEKLAAFGMPEAVAKMFAGFDRDAGNNQLFDDSKTLSKLIGRPTTPLSAAIKKALG